MQAKQVRLVDVASRANVSRVMAGHVLMGSGGKNTRVSEQTALRVRTVARELGYRPNRIAQQLRGCKSKLIGVFNPPVPLQYLYTRLINFEEAADQYGYRILIGRLSSDEGKTLDCLNDFLSRNIEGLLFLHPIDEAHERLIELLETVHVPVICTDTFLRNGITLKIDRPAGVEMAVEHLLCQGYKRIGLSLINRQIASMCERQQGYERALKKKGLYDPGLVYSAEVFKNTRDSDSRWEESTLRTIENLIFKHRADAIIASNDVNAAYLIKHLNRLGVCVPSEVGIIGFDNSNVTSLTSPGITSVDQQDTLIAAELMEAFIKSTAGQTVLENTIINKPQIVIRGSTLKNHELNLSSSAGFSEKG